MNHYHHDDSMFVRYAQQVFALIKHSVAVAFEKEGLVQEVRMRGLEELSAERARFIIETLFASRQYVDSTANVEVKYPDGWWQAFKQQYFSKWLLKRFPVKYKIVVVETKTIIEKLCPHVVPNSREHVDFLTIREKLRATKEDFGLGK
jgi:hypothetical protein